MRSIPKDADRCTFVSTDGRRCCMTRVAPDAAFCFDHWQKHQQQEEDARVGEEIVASDDPLNTQESIHKALCNVFRLLARNRISSRNAAVLGYVAQMMLLSRPSIERTIQSALPLLQLSLRTGHLEKKSNALAADQLHKHALQELEITQGTIELFKAFRDMSPEEGLRFMQFVRDFSDKKGPAPAAQPSSDVPAGTPDAKPQGATNAKS